MDDRQKAAKNGKCLITVKTKIRPTQSNNNLYVDSHAS